MKLTPPDNLLKWERVIGIHPSLATRVNKCWSKRLNFYMGRTLTHSALNIEQKHRSNHMAMIGRQLSTGVVEGLELDLEALSQTDLTDPPEPMYTEMLLKKQYFHITPGIGVTASGEDITVSAPIRVQIDKIPVIGQNPDNHDGPKGIGIIVLQPIIADDAGIEESTDPCEIDPSDDAFAEWQLVDGCRVAWFPWPESWTLPVPPYGDRLRNILSHFIFEQEIKSSDLYLPWEKSGIPLALVRILDNNIIDFIDRYAVVRQGGSPLARRALVSTSGNPFLWQARMLNFSTHMGELQKKGLPLSEAIDHFRYLPPVGVLPFNMVDLANSRVDFLPSSYHIDAIPIPLEQFEIPFEASAPLLPFDLYIPDRLQILVPVEQSLYDPQLLKREQVDDIFEQTINELLEHIGKTLSRRQVLRQMEHVIQNSISSDIEIGFPDVDPDAVSGEVPVPDDNVTNHAIETINVLTKLYNFIDENSPLSDVELGQLNPGTKPASDSDAPTHEYPEIFIGIRNFIKKLEENADICDDKINFSFLRLHTDVYRIRQMMLGNIQATRLATSPILANIAKGDTNLATQQKLQTYFDRTIKKSAKSKIEVNDGNGDNVTVQPIRSGLFNLSPMDYFSRDSGLMADRVSPRIEEIMPDYSIITDMVEPKMVMAEAMWTQPEFVGALGTTSSELSQQAPIVGEALEVRSSTIAERLEDPPGPEAMSYAVATKAAVLASLSELPINLENINISMTAKNNSAILAKTLYDTWYAKFTFSDMETNILVSRVKPGSSVVTVNLSSFTENEISSLGNRVIHFREALNQLIGSKHPLTTQGLSSMVLSGLFDPKPIDGDEAAFLSNGVVALENTIAMLRKIEGRVNQYRKAATKCKTALKKLYKIVKKWKTDLLKENQELLEYRHDITVARSLLAEEISRAKKINRQRSDILKNHVPFIAYIRPRTVSLNHNVPLVEMHGIFKDPVPACFNKDIAIPDELEAFIALFKDVPLKWLPSVKALMAQIDRPDKFIQVFKHVKQKAQLIVSQPVMQTQETMVSSAASFMGQTIHKVIAANKQSNLLLVQQKANMNLQVIEKMTWKEIKTQAQDALTLADLMESGKGKSSLARKAALEIEHIQDVAGGLYTRCGTIPPAIRLLWADTISEFDKPVNLRNLENLPGWEDVDFDFRRDLQRLADWLFSRIYSKIPQAVILVNDLVRVCILLASHAPVSSIINGHVPEPKTGKVGDVINLIPDAGKVSVGMKVAIYNNLKIAVHGIVEDISAKAAIVKVTHSENTTFHIDQGAKAQFLPTVFGKY